MIQALIKKGRVFPADVPAPAASPGGLLVKTVRSCISIGTEAATVAGSGRSLIRKALAQPAKVAEVLRMARQEGIARTVAMVNGELNMAEPTGYSLSGIVVGVGLGVTDFQPGDRVAAAGQGIANHAEYVDVPVNLAVPMPEGLDFDAAATVTLGAIAMQGVRRAEPQLGEVAVVYGVGALGQLAAQMLTASGARVLAVDLDRARRDIAVAMGAEAAISPTEGDAVGEVLRRTGGHGADVVVFCAATANPAVLTQAFAMTRKKGRVVMVGTYGRELSREAIYKKEIDFRISCSYGPGRYDEAYERRGLDYPYAYVRWTENRNMAEYLRLAARGRIRVEPLIQAVHPIASVTQAFETLRGPQAPLLALLDYGEPLPEALAALAAPPRRIDLPLARCASRQGRVRLGLIGAGSFAVGYHLPNIQSLDGFFSLRAVCNRTGSRASNVAARFGAAYAATDHREILADPDIDAVMICTRHDRHGPLVLESLAAGKHVFVEKPLCTRPEELAAIRRFYADRRQAGDAPLLMVGFNRRFSKYALEIKRHVAQRSGPLWLHYVMHAGHLPPDHWTHGEEGGGRIVGEACHALDMLSFLVDAPVARYAAAGVRPPHDSDILASDNRTILLEYADGSLGILEYRSLGAPGLPKERLEVHFDGKTVILDNYTRLEGHGLDLASVASPTPDKGLREELEAMAACLVAGRPWPISLDSMLETTAVTLGCVDTDAGTS